MDALAATILTRLFQQAFGKRPFLIWERPFHLGLSQVMQFSLWADTSGQTFNPAKTLKRHPLQRNLTGLEAWVDEHVPVRTAVPDLARRIWKFIFLSTIKVREIGLLSWLYFLVGSLWEGKRPFSLPLPPLTKIGRYCLDMSRSGHYPICKMGRQLRNRFVSYLSKGG